MDFSFVPKIDTRSIDQETLQGLRAAATPGSHLDIILKESLMDQDYDLGRLDEVIERHATDTFMTSFPSPAFTARHLLYRSEFVLLSYLGGRQFSFQNDMEDFLHFVESRVLKISPLSLIYRLCDYNIEDFSFLRGESGGLTSRGAQRLIDDVALFDLDMQVIARLARLGIPVKVLVPCVQFPEQFTLLRERMDEYARRLGFVPEQVGMMLELPANLHQIGHYMQADFFIFGPGDLLKFYYGGLDRNDKNFSKVDSSIILRGITQCLDDLNAQGRKTSVYFAKSLIGLRDQIPEDRYKNIQFMNLYMPNQLMQAYTLGEQDATAPPDHNDKPDMEYRLNVAV